MNTFKKAHSKQMIRQEVLSLLKTTPFYKIKIKDLATRLNISRSTFYSYYESIYDVIQEMEDEFMADMVSLECMNLLDSNHVNTAPITTLRTMEYIYNNKEVFLALTGPNGDASFSIRLEARLKKGFYDMLKKMNCPESRCSLFSEFFSTGQVACAKYTVSTEDFSDPEVRSQLSLTTHIILFYSIRSLL